ncbi:MAG TPA: hypothetical protein VG028_18650 [Terriglobia bacterium]|nr:hypothetical protein [Terriglobia bacterium]
MRRFLFMVVAVSVLVSPAWMLKASPRGNPEVQALKAQQKRESNAFKINERNVKQSFKGRQVPRAVRDQQLHQLQRDKRAMKERHRNQLQELKDRQRMMRDNVRQ